MRSTVIEAVLRKRRLPLIFLLVIVPLACWMWVVAMAALVNGFRPFNNRCALHATQRRGQAVAVQSLASLVPMYEAIGRDLRHLYRIGYVPSPLAHDGRGHAVSVRVPGQDVRVRTRSGYYAPRPPWAAID